MLFLPTYTADAWYHKKLAGGPPGQEASGCPRRGPGLRPRGIRPGPAQGEHPRAGGQGGHGSKDRALHGSRSGVHRQRQPAHLAQPVRQGAPARRAPHPSAGSTGGSRVSISTPPESRTSSIRPTPRSSGPFPAALNAYVRGELKYKNDTPYAVSGDVRPWSYENVQNQYLNTAETLRGAMAANQFLKVFVANGYYDGATPFFATEYTFFQTDLAGDLKGRGQNGLLRGRPHDVYP